MWIKHLKTSFPARSSPLSWKRARWTINTMMKKYTVDSLTWDADSPMRMSLSFLDPTWRKKYCQLMTSAVSSYGESAIGLLGKRTKITTQKKVLTKMICLKCSRCMTSLSNRTKYLIKPIWNWYQIAADCSINIATGGGARISMLTSFRPLKVAVSSSLGSKSTVSMDRVQTVIFLKSKLILADR